MKTRLLVWLRSCLQRLPGLRLVRERRQVGPGLLRRLGIRDPSVQATVDPLLANHLKDAMQGPSVRLTERLSALDRRFAAQGGHCQLGLRGDHDALRAALTAARTTHDPAPICDIVVWTSGSTNRP